MIFVTVNNDRKQLREMTELLHAAFQGSIIYEYTDPMLSAKHIVNHPVDAVFAEADMKRVDGPTLLRVVRVHKPDLPVFIMSDGEAYRALALGQGADEYLVRPVTEEMLCTALRSLDDEEETG